MDEIDTLIESASESAKEEWRYIKTIIKRVSPDCLNLSDINLTTIPPIIRKYRKLEKLDLSKNNITKINLNNDYTYGIDESLKILILSYNKINDISGLFCVSNLTKLHLNNNQITTITDLANLRYLKNLDLSSNKITDISALKHLKKLEILNLNNNQIKNISALKHLKKLEYLYLRGNQIKKLPQKLFNNLKGDLDISNNNISIINELLNMNYYIRIIINNNKIFNINCLNIIFCPFDQMSKNTLILLKQYIKNYVKYL